MEDMATGEIRLSILWEWLHKGAVLTEGDESLAIKAGDVFSKNVFNKLLDEEYRKLLNASDKDVFELSKTTTLPISKEIVAFYVSNEIKMPWFIDLLNLNLNNTDLSVARQRIKLYFETLRHEHKRITENPDFG
jgi:malate synthase